MFAIAQTPCTHTAVSGARDFETKGGYMLVDAIVLFEAARQVCEWSGAPYMMENPVTMLSSIPHIGKPNYYFNPSDYTGFELGDNYTKKTCIWAGNGFVMPDPRIAPDLGKPDNRIHFASPGSDRADFRAAAPMGFARAVFQVNSPTFAKGPQHEDSYPTIAIQPSGGGMIPRSYDSWKTRSPEDDLGSPDDEVPSPEQQWMDYEDEMQQASALSQAERSYQQEK